MDIELILFLHDLVKHYISYKEQGKGLFFFFVFVFVFFNKKKDCLTKQIGGVYVWRETQIFWGVRMFGWKFRQPSDSLTTDKQICNHIQTKFSFLPFLQLIL